MRFAEKRASLAWTANSVLCLLLVATCAPASFAQGTNVVAPLTASQVVENLVARNEQRALTLESYQGTRLYHLEYRGLGRKSADLVVAMTYRRPGEKKFTIVSESGSELLQNRVLKQLLEAESEAIRQEQRRQTALHPENYEFRLVAFEPTLGNGLYVLEVTPRTKNKFLFRGRIWVDGLDFAVARMEGEPAKRPSWWTTRNLIQVTYQKIGNFWLPVRNETITQLRILGGSILTIVYQDYQIEEKTSGLIAHPSVETSASARKAP